ncbi:MAG: coenzyme F420 hydrogenase [Cyanothece sp. SIO1E1]|nr:coenzyme F420 hydrogenase [Cyanothece sp. SIO1E1]
MKLTNEDSLGDTVIKGGYCIGCGVCAGLAPAEYAIVLNEYGLFQAEERLNDPEVGEKVSKICPFSNNAKSEKELSEEFLTDARLFTFEVGKFIECYAGRVVEDSVYQASSSGGIGRWFLSKLLSLGEVDYVVHVIDNKSEQVGELIYKFSIARTEEDVFNSAKSAYYPVEMSHVIRFILENPGRYAITGVPCFIKAIRNLSLVEPVVRDRIRFTVGIVCGHLKGAFYAEMIGWQLGVKPDFLCGLDFRVKVPGKKANDKGVRAVSSVNCKEKSSIRTVREIFGTGYAQGYFKNNACDYCDDVLAETADISIGDAWLPEYLDASTSIVVVRNKKIKEILENGIQESELRLESISAGRVAESQAGGLRHRRDGLQYRLYLKRKRNEWFPVKRVEPKKKHLSWRRRWVLRLRMEFTQKSFVHFKDAKAKDD